MFLKKMWKYEILLQIRTFWREKETNVGHASCKSVTIHPHLAPLSFLSMPNYSLFHKNLKTIYYKKNLPLMLDFFYYRNIKVIMLKKYEKQYFLYSYILDFISLIILYLKRIYLIILHFKILLNLYNFIKCLTALS